MYTKCIIVYMLYINVVVVVYYALQCLPMLLCTMNVYCITVFTSVVVMYYNVLFFR